MPKFCKLCAAFLGLCAQFLLIVRELCAPFSRLCATYFCYLKSKACQLNICIIKIYNSASTCVEEIREGRH